MPAIPVHYVNCVGVVGLVAFGLLSYQWIERKRRQGPLPQWFKEYLKEVKRQRGELEDEEALAPVSTLSPADGIAGLVCICMPLLCLMVDGWILNCQYRGNISSTMSCMLNCTYNGTSIYEGPCYLATTQLKLNMTFRRPSRAWHNMVLRVGLQYYLDGRIMHRLYVLSNLSTAAPFMGSLQCSRNASNHNETQGAIVLESEAWGRNVLSVTSRDRRNLALAWTRENVTEFNGNVSEALADIVFNWLKVHAGTDRFFLSDVCLRLLNRLKRFTKSPVKVTNENITDNITYGILEWPTWTQVTQMWIAANTYPRLSWCAWGIFSLSAVVLAAVMLLGLFGGLVQRSRKHMQNDIHEMCMKRQEIRASIKSQFSYINESANLRD
ncbi:envelope glycoprotein UL37 [Cercopithecine betaherpesvirus 5]|uniref:Envelope glycoprotein UL37 n=1 Tax=Simian cytomegalovirus (strain Colburn) TaxID=50292 RepID=G8XTU3_SCMVC|nr:envelope glycoprotein UL37 [Cercopithecine betaherpesvirus 5]